MHSVGVMCIEYMSWKSAPSSHPWKALGRSDKRRTGTLRRNDLSGKVRCCLWGPVNGRKVPIGVCDRLHVVDFEGPASHFAADIQVRKENGGEHSGW